MAPSHLKKIEELGAACHLCGKTEKLVLQGRAPDGAHVHWSKPGSKSADVAWRVICLFCKNARPSGPEKHNWAAYVHGCRCGVCTKAMADYGYTRQRHLNGPPKRYRPRRLYDDTVPPPEERPFWGVPSDVIPVPATGWWTDLGRE